MSFRQNLPFFFFFSENAALSHFNKIFQEFIMIDILDRCDRQRLCRHLLQILCVILLQEVIVYVVPVMD